MKFKWANEVTKAAPQKSKMGQLIQNGTMKLQITNEKIYSKIA